METRATPARYPGEDPVLRLPMRDGNKTKFYREGVTEGSSQTTYEGWKLLSMLKRHSAYKVLRLPMRDGNKEWAKYANPCDTSSQTTYEGWKPILADCLCDPLPMSFLDYL